MTRAAAIAAIGLVFFAADAGADPKQAPAVPCVAIDVSDDALDERGRARLVEQLDAALAQHRIAACRPETRAAAIAEVTFEGAGRSGVAIRIRVHDAVTSKDVARIVTLASTPRDGRPLAVALAADELLRASWAEIALAPAPPETPPPEAKPIAPPPEIRAVVDASLASSSASSTAPSSSSFTPSSRALAVDLAFVYEHATGGLDQAGVDLRGAAWVAPRVALTLRLGARLSPRSDAADGSADANAILAGLGAAVALVPRDRTFGLEWPLRIDGERLDFSVRPAPGARGTNDAGYALIASTGIAASFRFARAWAFVVEADAGYVLRPIEAFDGEASFTALSGAWLGASLALRALP